MPGLHGSVLAVVDHDGHSGGHERLDGGLMHGLRTLTGRLHASTAEMRNVRYFWSVRRQYYIVVHTGAQRLLPVQVPARSWKSRHTSVPIRYCPPPPIPPHLSFVMGHALKVTHKSMRRLDGGSGVLDTVTVSIFVILYKSKSMPHPREHF